MFKHRRSLIGAFALTLGTALILAWAGGTGARAQDGAAASQAPLGTAFTYQGQLTADGEPAVGPCDFRFSLYDAASDGSQVGSTLTQTGVELSDGRFTVILDFGVGIFTGDARWLEIAVQCAGDSDYVTLGRTALKAAPYALYASGAPWSGLRNVPADLADGDDDTIYSAGTGLSLAGSEFSVGTRYRLPQTCGNGQIAEWNGSAWACGDDDVGTGGGGGDITAVYAGTGLSGGGTSGDVTLSADTGYLQRRVGGTCSSGNAIRVIGSDGSVTCQSVIGGNDHNHLGQTWTGTDNALRIEGSFGSPDSAPLVLSNTDQLNGNGLIVNSAGYDGVAVFSAGADGVYVLEAGEHGFSVDSAGYTGVRVLSADLEGVFVGSAGEDGVNVYTAGGDGFHVCRTGDRTGCTPDLDNHHGLEVGNAEDDGVHVTSAGGYGVKVESAGIDGVFVESADYYGMRVWEAGWDGVYVRSAGDDGIRVCGTGGRTSCTPDSTRNHGLEVGNAQHNGVHVVAAGNNGVEIWNTYFDGVQVNNAGRDGVRADADENGVYANTLDVNNEWGFNTPDKIYGSNITTAGPLTFVAQNGGIQDLEAGEVVAGIGLAKPFTDGPDPVPLVGRADGTSRAGVIGVVLSGFVAEEEVEEIETDNGVEMRTRFRTHSAEGPVAPGEHMLIVVLGVAQVKVDPGTQIEAGQRLTASDLAGSARALQSRTLDGMVVTEGAPVVGVALAAPKPGEATIPVFVTLR